MNTICSLATTNNLKHEIVSTNKSLHTVIITYICQFLNARSICGLVLNNRLLLKELYHPALYTFWYFLHFRASFTYEGALSSCNFS